MKYRALVRNSGTHQWDAVVGCNNPKTGERTKQNVTVFCNDRVEAVREACAVVADYGYSNCTVNHITKI